MNFAIMRSKKIKTVGNMAASLRHCYRERETPNADETKTHENTHLLAKTTDQAMGKLREILPEKRRKDAVISIEYMMTASPEWWEKATKEEQQEFFKKSVEWLEEKYEKKNIIVATIHHDETSPHLSAFVVPITKDGRLSAKEFIGDRKKMSQDQTNFHEKVEYLKLDRGIIGSNAQHQSIKQYYANLKNGLKNNISIDTEELQPKILKKGIIRNIIEGDEMISERLSKKINQEISPIIIKAHEKLNNEKTIKDLRKVSLDQQKLIKKLSTTFKGLSLVQEIQIKKMISDFKQQNELETKKLTKEKKLGKEGFGLDF